MKTSNIKKSLLAMVSLVLIFSLYSCKTENNTLLFAGLSDSDTGIETLPEEIKGAGGEDIVEKPEMKGRSFTQTINGREYTGIYCDSSISPYRNCDSDSYYVKENDGTIVTFNVNCSSRKLISFLLGNYPCETTKENGLSYEACRQIAIQKLHDYDNSSTFIEKETQNDSKNCYHFMFVKTLEDIETSGIVLLTVNTDGIVTCFSARTMPAFDELGNLGKKLRNIEDRDIKLNIKTKLSEIFKGRDLESWEINERTLSVLKEVGPAIEYRISVLWGKEKIEVEGSMEEFIYTVGVLLIRQL